MQHAEFRSALSRLNAVCHAEGIRSALGFLNGLTTHRFSAIYRFDDRMLTNLYFFDRLDPAAMTCQEIPVLASYCVFVRDSSRTFSTEDAPRDGRVDGHPKQHLVKSYCGVPLRDSQGRVFGTICHFDFDPMEISEVSVELMDAMGLLLSQMPALGVETPRRDIQPA